MRPIPSRREGAIHWIVPSFEKPNRRDGHFGHGRDVGGNTIMEVLNGIHLPTVCWIWGGEKHEGVLPTSMRVLLCVCFAHNETQHNIKSSKSRL